MDKTNLFFGTLPFSPWVVLATWLHLEAPQILQEKWTYYKENEIIHNFCIQTRNCARLILPGS
jgi:hypothetical protein